MYRFLYFAPSHLTCSSKCLTNLKGLPLVLCPTVIEHTGYQRLRERFLSAEFYFNRSSFFMWERRRRGRHCTTQRSGLLAAAQPISKRGRAHPLLLVLRMWKGKAGPCINFNRPHASLFLCILDMKQRKESDWSASLLAWSPRQSPHRHQHFVSSLTVMRQRKHKQTHTV